MSVVSLSKPSSSSASDVESWPEASESSESSRSALSTDRLSGRAEPSVDEDALVDDVSLVEEVLDGSA